MWVKKYAEMYEFCLKCENVSLSLPTKHVLGHPKTKTKDQSAPNSFKTTKIPKYPKRTKILHKANKIT